MANPVITEDQLEEFVTGILNSQYTSIDESSVERWEGGSKIQLTLGQVERDEDQIFCIEGRVDAIHTGEEESGSSYAFKCDLATEDKLHVVGSGWLSLPEYSDDESDGYLTVTLYVCRKKDLEKARELVTEAFSAAIVSAIEAHLKAATELFGHAGAGLRQALSKSPVVREIMRTAASGL